MKVITVLLLALSSVSAFMPHAPKILNIRGGTTTNAITITDGVTFDTIAREWRLKWSPDDDKKSLQEVQKAADSVLSTVKSVAGIKDVQRVVCGGCLDYKMIISLNADDFGAWEESNFAPEADFLDAVKGIDGVSTVETQTF